MSGIHGTGMGDLMDEVIKPFGQAGSEIEEKDKPLGICILGKPNVGKSSLLNRLTGTDRAIVSAVAGTTRDVIDQTLRREGKDYVFLDTAGVRRGSKVGRGVEELMVRRALKAARRADVCLLVIDATDGLSEQARRTATAGGGGEAGGHAVPMPVPTPVPTPCPDAAPVLRPCCAHAAPMLRLCRSPTVPTLRLCRAHAAPVPVEQESRLSTFANEAGRACVVVVNKWDLVANKDDRLYRTSRSYVESKLSDVSWAQCVYVSAKTGLKTQELFKAIDAAAEQHQRRVGTSVMNEARHKSPHTTSHRTAPHRTASHHTVSHHHTTPYRATHHHRCLPHTRTTHHHRCCICRCSRTLCAGRSRLRPPRASAATSSIARRRASLHLSRRSLFHTPTNRCLPLTPLPSSDTAAYRCLPLHFRPCVNLLTQTPASVLLAACSHARTPAALTSALGCRLSLPTHVPTCQHYTRLGVGQAADHRDLLQRPRALLDKLPQVPRDADAQVTRLRRHANPAALPRAPRGQGCGGLVEPLPFAMHGDGAGVEGCARIDWCSTLCLYFDKSRRGRTVNFHAPRGL